MHGRGFLTPRDRSGSVPHSPLCVHEPGTIQPGFRSLQSYMPSGCFFSIREPFHVQSQAFSDLLARIPASPVLRILCLSCANIAHNWEELNILAGIYATFQNTSFMLYADLGHNSLESSRLQTLVLLGLLPGNTIFDAKFNHQNLRRVDFYYLLKPVLDDHGSLDPFEAVDLNNPCQDRIDLNQLLEAICRSWIKSIWNRLIT